MFGGKKKKLCAKIILKKKTHIAFSAMYIDNFCRMVILSFLVRYLLFGCRDEVILLISVLKSLY